MEEMIKSQNQATEQQNIAQGSKDINVSSQVLSEEELMNRFDNIERRSTTSHNNSMEQNDSNAQEPKNVVSSPAGATSVESTTEALENEGVTNPSKENGDDVPEAKAALERTDMVIQLKEGKEVQLRDFKKAGFKFADMDKDLQRGETKKGVNVLVASLKNAKAFYRPIELMSAREFLEAGRKVFKVDGTELLLTNPNVDLYWVRLDGKQRSIAYAKLFLDKDYVGKEGGYDVRVTLAHVDIKNVDKYVREIQTSTVWDEATKRQTAVAKLGKTESGLTLINKFISETKMSARAAYKHVYYKDGYKKELYEQSMRDGQVVPALQAKDELIKRALHDYHCFKVAFREHPEYFKNSAAIDALISVYGSVSKDPNEEVSTYLKCLQQLQETDFASISSKKAVTEKEAEFLRLFKEFKENLSTDPSFSSTVDKRIEEAEKQYKEIEKIAENYKAAEKVKKTTEEKYFTA